MISEGRGHTTPLIFWFKLVTISKKIFLNVSLKMELLKHLAENSNCLSKGTVKT